MGTFLNLTYKNSLNDFVNELVRRASVISLSVSTGSEPSGHIITRFCLDFRLAQMRGANMTRVTEIVVPHATLFAKHGVSETFFKMK